MVILTDGTIYPTHNPEGPVVKFYTKYDRPLKDFALDQGDEKSLTRQSEADSADINKIMERFDRTGQLPVSMKVPNYGDARIVDFQTAKQIVLDAQTAFNDLPVKARVYFNHDPQNMLNALADTSELNNKKLFDLGILVEKQEEPIDTLKRIAANTVKEKEAPTK